MAAEVMAIPLTQFDKKQCELCEGIRRQINLDPDHAAPATNCIFIWEGEGSTVKPENLNFICTPHAKSVIRALNNQLEGEED